MAKPKNLVVRSAFGKSLASTVLLSVHPDESHDDYGDPLANARTLLLDLRADRAVFREERPVALMTNWLSPKGVAYCGSTQGSTLHVCKGGKWSEEAFAPKPVETVRYVYGVPGEKPEDDTLFVSTDNELFIRERGKWLKKRIPGEGFPWQMEGQKPDHVYIGGPELLLWDGKKLNALDAPDDDNISSLTVTADDRLIGGNTYISISTPEGEWERIDTPVEGFMAVARLGDDVFAASSEDGVVKVYPGKPKVVTKAMDVAGIVSVGDGLIAYGSGGVLAYDGKKWTSVKLPACEKGKLPV